MNQIVQHPFRHGHAQRTTFGYITNEHPRLDRFQNTMSAISGLLAALSLLTIILLTLTDVFLRAAFSAPQGWISGLITDFLLPTTAFFGIVTAYRSGSHVAIVSLFNKFPDVAKKVVLLVGYIIVAACLLLIMLGGWRSMAFSYQENLIIPPGMADLPIPDWVLASPMPLAAALGLILVLVDIYREATSTWRHATTDYDPGDVLEEITDDPSSDSSGQKAAK